jgi:thiamine kinase-like enzyme
MSEGSSTYLGSLTTFDNSQPLVFCNQYLNPDNFIVGDDGRLWLADWPFAGFYPPWFEFATMRIQAKYDKQYLRWDAMIPFVCGWYFEQERWLKCIVMPLSWI